MNCEKCKQKEANVRIVKVVNNQKQEVFLCQDCAAKENSFLFSNSSFSVSDFLSSFMNYSPSQKPMIKSDLECSKCNLTWDDFRTGSRLGCDNCYETFKDKLMPIIRQIHGQVEHQGHIPPLEGMQKIHRVKKLKESLQLAIIDERYEEAAKIRDEIKSLEEEV